MRILAISDEAAQALYHAGLHQLVGPVELLIGCGDLPYGYMDFVVTQSPARYALFVHGNHDRPIESHDGTVTYHPGGWTNIDRRTVYLKDLDLVVGGLQGSVQYSGEGAYQYTETQMTLRALRLVRHFLRNKVLRGRYVDILVAHSPAESIHDTPGGAHRGFRIFRWLIRRFRPRLFLHGHNHCYGQDIWYTRFAQTDVVNAHPYRIIDFEADSITVNRRTLGIDLVCNAEIPEREE